MTGGGAPSPGAGASAARAGADGGVPPLALEELSLRSNHRVGARGLRVLARAWAVPPAADGLAACSRLTSVDLSDCCYAVVA